MNSQENGDKHSNAFCTHLPSLALIERLTSARILKGKRTNQWVSTFNICICGMKWKARDYLQGCESENADAQNSVFMEAVVFWFMPKQ